MKAPGESFKISRHFFLFFALFIENNVWMFLAILKEPLKIHEKKKKKHFKKITVSR